MEYEEKLQRMEAQNSLIKDELKNNQNSSNITIAAYHEVIFTF